MNNGELSRDADNQMIPTATTAQRAEIEVPVHVRCTTCTEAIAQSEASYSTEQSKGFVIVGDNLDKNFRPSHQREDRQTKSLHV